MSRIEVTDEHEDRLFDVFAQSQDLQRRVLRIVSRGFFSAAAVEELVSQSEGIASDIKSLVGT